MADLIANSVLAGMDNDAIVQELINRVAQRKLFDYEPYPYQSEFHEAGNVFPERMLMAGNRVGKTHGACAEDAMHLIGEYPDWWEGKRFNYATRGWVVSITNETSRDILQAELLGNPIGTGLIPANKIIDIKYRQAGISNVVDTVHVRHVSGNSSTATFKTYEQGWRKFQGAAIDFVHMDEEPDNLSIYTECRTRIITRNGIMYTTMTPLMGETDLVNRFKERKEGTFMITASMRECPHLKGKVENILRDYPEHEKDARMDGTPIMGEGRVFPFGDGEVLCSPEPLAAHWGRIAGIDFGINQHHQQAAAWLAHDRDSDIVYLYDEYKRPDASAVYHAEALRTRGDWIPVAWPHDGVHREKGSGQQLRDVYLKHNVPMLSTSACYSPKKLGAQPLEPIITEISERIRTGRFKVFAGNRKFMDEFRSFHRKDGIVVSKKDDLIKAVFYAFMMLRFAAVEHRYDQPRPTQPCVSMWANA